MPPRWIKGRLQKDRYGGAEDANALPEANASIANDTSKPESVARESLSSDHAQTIDHHRRQPAAKRLKQDDQDDNQAEAPSEQSTNADADNASRQRASGSSDDAWYSGSEEDSDSDGDSPAGFVQCGYLQSTTDPSDIIHLRMNLRKGEFQLLRLGKADDCEIYLEGPEVAPRHCVIRLVLSVSKDGSVVRKVLIQTGGRTFRLKPDFYNLQKGDLIRFGRGPWFRLWKAEFHQLYHRADAVQNDPGANSTVARVRRGHDGMVCVVKTIAADRAGMGVKEVSAYADLGKHSNIVRMLEWFHDETFYDYHLVLEEATTDLTRFVNLVRSRSQADLRTAASVWTKAMTSAVHLLVGTPGWIAPAAFRQSYDDRSVDCYGVGRVLFFILTHHEWPSEASVPEDLCGCPHGCPEACVERESEFRHLKQSGVNAECVQFLRQVLVGSPEMCMDSKEMLEHSYVSYVPRESEQARIDSALARLNFWFNRLSRET